MGILAAVVAALLAVVVGFLAGSRRLRGPLGDAPGALGAPLEPDPTESKGEVAPPWAQELLKLAEKGPVLVGDFEGGGDVLELRRRVERLEVDAETRHQQVLSALRSATNRLNGQLGGRGRRAESDEPEDVSAEQLAQLGQQLQMEMAGRRNGGGEPAPLDPLERLRRLKRGH